jgi:hypothetical protein
LVAGGAGVWSLYAFGAGAAWAGVVAVVLYGGVRDIRRALRTGRMVGRGEVYDRRVAPLWFWAHFLQSAAVWLFDVAFLAAVGAAAVWRLRAFGAG